MTDEPHSTAPTSSNPDFIPEGDTYLKHRRFVRELVTNGGKREEAYLTAFEVNRVGTTTISKLMAKNYIRGWIKDLEEEAFIQSSVTLSWAIDKMKEVYKAAFKAKRYKEAIVAVDRAVAYSGKSPLPTGTHVGELGDSTKPYMFVVPEKVPIGAPVADVEDTKEAEERFDQEQITINTQHQQPTYPSAIDETPEPTERDARIAFDKIKEITGHNG